MVYHQNAFRVLLEPYYESLQPEEDTPVSYVDVKRSVPEFVWHTGKKLLEKNPEANQVIVHFDDLQHTLWVFKVVRSNGCYFKCTYRNVHLLKVVQI